MSVLVMSRIRHAVIVPQPLGAGQERAAKISRKIVPIFSHVPEADIPISWGCLRQRSLRNRIPRYAPRL